MIGLLAIARLALVESEIRELVIAIMWSTITAAFAAARELVMIAVAVPMLAAVLGMVIAAVATAFMSAVVGELVRPTARHHARRGHDDGGGRGGDDGRIVRRDVLFHHAHAGRAP